MLTADADCSLPEPLRGIAGATVDGLEWGVEPAAGPVDAGGAAGAGQALVGNIPFRNLRTARAAEPEAQ